MNRLCCCPRRSAASACRSAVLGGQGLGVRAWRVVRRRGWRALACRGSVVFFFSSRRRHTRCSRDWSSDVCSSDLAQLLEHFQRGRVDLTAEMFKELSASWKMLQNCGVCGEVTEWSFAEAPVEAEEDRKSVVEGKSVDLGGRRIIKKKKRNTDTEVA